MVTSSPVEPDVYAPSAEERQLADRAVDQVRLYALSMPITLWADVAACTAVVAPAAQPVVVQRDAAERRLSLLSAKRRLREGRN